MLIDRPFRPYICILGKPIDIPSACPLDVSNHELKPFKIQCRDSVKAHVQEDQCPFEESVCSVCFLILVVERSHDTQEPLTSGDFVNLVLYEKVDERNQCPEEGAGQNFPVLKSFCVSLWTKCYAPQGPGQRSHQIRDHEDVMPAMVVRRRNVCPSTTRECTEDPYTCHKFWQYRIRSCREDIPEEDEGKARA